MGEGFLVRCRYRPCYLYPDRLYRVTKDRVLGVWPLRWEYENERLPSREQKARADRHSPEIRFQLDRDLRTRELLFGRFRGG